MLSEVKRRPHRDERMRRVPRPGLTLLLFTPATSKLVANLNTATSLQGLAIMIFARVSERTREVSNHHNEDGDLTGEF